jgi:hypothetical protein
VQHSDRLALQGCDQIHRFLLVCPPLCSAQVLNWRRSTVHAAVPSNFGGFAVLTQFSVPLPCTARALTCSS